MADNFDTLSKLQPMPDAVSNLSQGLDAGMKLATMQDQVQQKKLQTDQMRDQLDTQKYNKAMDSLHTLARMNPQFARKMIPRVQDQLQRAGIGVDPLVLDQFASDDAARARFLNSYDYMAGNAQDPDHRAAAMQAISDAGGSQDSLFKPAEAANKATMAENIANIKGTFAENVAKTKSEATAGTQQEKIDIQNQKIHMMNQRALDKDAPYLDSLKKYNSLQNALTNFQNADFHTPQQFDELQQAVRRNLMPSGQSGVNEREKTQLNSLGIDVGKFTQWLSGKPVSIEDLGGQPFVDHIKQLVASQSENLQEQAAKRAKAVLLKGNKSFYEAHPKLLNDLNDFATAQADQFTPPGQTTAAAPVASGTTQAAPGPAPTPAQTPPPAATPAPPAAIALAKQKGMSKQDFEKRYGAGSAANW